MTMRGAIVVATSGGAGVRRPIHLMLVVSIVSAMVGLSGSGAIDFLVDAKRGWAARLPVREGGLPSPGVSSRGRGCRSADAGGRVQAVLAFDRCDPEPPLRGAVPTGEAAPERGDCGSPVDSTIGISPNRSSYRAIASPSTRTMDFA